MKEGGYYAKFDDSNSVGIRNDGKDGIMKTAKHASAKRNNDVDDDNEEALLRRGGPVRLLDVYKFRQKYGYFSIFFSVIQTIILLIMMIQCGIAPISINPMVGPYPDALNYWGAKNAALIVGESNEYWRLLSPILLHAGILHLVGNVSVQIDLGIFFEKEWGSLRWLMIYISSAIGSSILSTAAMPDVISVGSSGAVMGLLGAKLMEIICRWCEPRITVQQKVGHAIRKQLCGGMVMSITIVMVFSFLPFVDWAAHLGGLITGMIVGLVIFAVTYMKHIMCRILWFFTGLILLTILGTVSLIYMYNDVQFSNEESLLDICGYYQQFFEGYECTCTIGNNN